MLIVMSRESSPEAIDKVTAEIRDQGLDAHVMPGAQRVAIGVTGNKDRVRIQNLESFEGVLEIIHVSSPYKLVSREMHPQTSVIEAGGVPIGGEGIVVMAGPCAVESREQIVHIAREVKARGAHFLRGGAYKPRTSPYSFQGLKEEGLEHLAAARAETGLPIVTEVVDPGTVPAVAEVADMLQIGARNMQNFSLLEAAGRARKPVMLKRGMSATIKDLLLAAEYILNQGNYDVVLCERGIRTFEDSTRNTFDLNAIPVVHSLSHLPIMADPSHATGNRSVVTPMARAAVAAGADAVMVEVHHDAAHALSDGPQALTPEDFGGLMEQLRGVASAIGRRLV